jgi:hypothetical protein
MFLNRTAINRDIALGGNPPFSEQQTVINGIVDTPGGAQRRDFPFNISMQDPILKAPTAWAWNVTKRLIVGTVPDFDPIDSPRSAGLSFLRVLVS